MYKLVNMTTFEKFKTNYKTRMLENVHSKGFCDALEKGLGLEEASEYADMYVLRTDIAIQNFEAVGVDG